MNDALCNMIEEAHDKLKRLRSEMMPMLFDDIFDSKDAYLADHCNVSHSSLEVFRESIPKYHAVFVTKTIQKEPPTTAMHVGRAIHTALLEPMNWQNKVFKKPDHINKRTISGKEEYDQWLKSIGGDWNKAILDAEDYDMVLRMRDAAWKEPKVKEYLERAGWTETPITWTDNDTGLRCKGIPDRFTEDGMILDVKTAREPWPSVFPRTAFNYGYHRQQAFYEAGVSSKDVEPRENVIIAVGNVEPFEVVAYTMPQEEMELGRREVRESLRELKQCVEFDSWTSRTHGKAMPCTFPYWAKRGKS